MKNFLIALDQLVNTLVWIKDDGFGNADETLSARAYRLRSRSNAHIWIDRLFWFEPDHCYDSFKSEILKRHLPNEYQIISNKLMNKYQEDPNADIDDLLRSM